MILSRKVVFAAKPLLLNSSSHFSSLVKPCNHEISTNSGQEFVKKYQEPKFELSPQETEIAQQIKRLILKSSNDTVENVIQSLQSDQISTKFQINSNIVDLLIQKFGDDWKSALGFFFFANSNLNYKHSTYACNKMIDLLGKMKQIDKMFDLLHEIQKTGSLTLETIEKVMRRLAGAKKWREIISLFDKLESLGFERDINSMNILLDTLCKERKVVLAREVFLELKAYIPPNEYTFNIFIHGWCKINKIEEAKWQIEEMKKYGIKPSVITYSTIVKAYCEQGNFPKVYEMLDLMIEDGCKPNLITYTTIMNSFAKFGRINEAMDIIKRMENDGCKPDTLFYNSLICIFGKLGDLNEASRIFEIEMEKNGVPYSLSTYNTMISIFCYHGKFESAFEILKKLEKLNLKPDLQTFRPLIKLCLSKIELNYKVRVLLDEILEKHNLSLDFDMYTLLIHGLCKKGDFMSGLRVFEEMMSREINPRNKTCEMLLNEAERLNLVEFVPNIRNIMNQIRKFQ
ncbi:hypothetical protein LUZ60_004490 [Juncus effusus]|nr:hypothetical protein LUZ60_004490 [Juncus effusus]